MRKGLIFLMLVAGWTALGSAVEAGPEPSSREAFDAWMAVDPAQRRAFAALSAYLAKEGVAEVVPVWQLARIDADNAARCGGGYFALPPRAQWPNIVPALRLVRDKVVPVTGRVEVVSSWRSQVLNACLGGAPRSAHRSFFALDLVATARGDDFRKLFADLCAMQRRAGAGSRMGLGAYFDPARLDANPDGRFHIDARGYRTWGFDYSAKTNPCPKLR
jgi:Peptidase M15